MARKALDTWTKEQLQAAKDWWATDGVALCGKRDAYNAIGEIDQALRKK